MMTHKVGSYTSPQSQSSRLIHASSSVSKRPRIGLLCISRLFLALGLLLSLTVVVTNVRHANDSKASITGARSYNGSGSDSNAATLLLSSESRNQVTINQTETIVSPETKTPRQENLAKPTARTASVTNVSSTIAYAVTITGCAGSTKINTTTAPPTTAATLPATPDFQIEDSAAILQYAIHRNSIRGDNGGQYDYQLYAIYHPQARSCVAPLADLGYTLLERDTPVKIEDIQGQFLRDKIAGNGCCGEKELIKFEAFTLAQHPAVVLLDLDVVILKPLDELFDWMIHRKRAPDHHLMWPNRRVPKDIRLFYTIDYAMVNPERKVKPAQGGFMIFRPDHKVYDNIMAIVRQGNYGDRGWENKTGKFWGSMTFQGLIPFYFFIKNRGHSVELNWCVHDNMASNPTEGHIRPGARKEKCFTNQETCADCRKRPLADIYSAHFTVCQKPWLCSRHLKPDPQQALCRQLDHAWFQIRSEMEQSWGRSGHGQGRTWSDSSHFYGYCHEYRGRGYERIQPPYGKPIVTTTSAVVQ